MPNFRKILPLAVGVAGLLAFDRLFKSIALYLDGRPPLVLCPNFFYFEFAANNGIAFSLPLSGWWLNGSIILILCALAVWLIQEAQTNAPSQKIFFLLLVIGGAASNLADRWLYVYVVDYLFLRYFTVFNLADAMIVAGVLGLSIWQWHSRRGQKKLPA
ncbi:hypothetical protein COX69_01385 [Candidatus Falkowbacteria bacterium CG_4_10_14_0_2_um_filter_48_10]|uniref:Lipoprotein signal peptidase n=1 Tax=Candidatus Falkowbacteria bacterium CG23_combo_of_CG06-09_8_20_14_all_49_15 TaxID=1974572 RepID=A0A2G9ZLE7_9BACT|nr:MAG: hypothetical protein COX22_01360 [Candidatus Falkowbacteria bacterium CG23_combo_of_CG06-09_8_20_14_all_49_15]PJA08763.1 MAG: hypothetical protein COX69_01385 [Candidatus Falkowbacteria bacterium CG_4_10_14_0_2_um_filter_48_10]